MFSRVSETGNPYRIRSLRVKYLLVLLKQLTLQYSELKVFREKPEINSNRQFLVSLFVYLGYNVFIITFQVPLRMAAGLVSM